MGWLRSISNIILGIPQVQNTSHEVFHSLFYKKQKEYIAREATVGTKVLGEIPSGHTRKFFCLDENTWIWSETWRDSTGNLQHFTVRYEIDPTGILKKINDGQYSKLSGVELGRFVQAVKSYQVEVASKVYNSPVTVV